MGDVRRIVARLGQAGFFLIPLILGTALTAVPVRADEKTGEAKTIKFELLKSMHMALQVKVNGKGPFRLIFDTGAPAIVVNNKLAKEAGVLSKDTKRPPITLFGAMGQFPLKSLEVGPIKLEDVQAMVVDHPTVAAMSDLFGPIDGIVGFPFFARFRTTIDYQAKEMTLSPVDYKPADIMQTMMATMMERMNDPNKPKILVPPAQWGILVDKSSTDEDPGITIKDIFKGSAAEKAGLKTGDRLLTLDGRWTDSILDLFEAATYVKPGQTVAVKIKRAGKDLELKVTPMAGL
jgi:hypothetical protein